TDAGQPQNPRVIAQVSSRVADFGPMRLSTLVQIRYFELSKTRHPSAADTFHAAQGDDSTRVIEYILPAETAISRLPHSLAHGSLGAWVEIGRRTSPAK